MKKYPSPADIEEMRARGYDPTTIREAEACSLRWLRAKELCRAIELAFADVKLGEGVGLQQGQGLDDYADADTCSAYRASDEKEDWRRMPVESLNRCNSSLSFFDTEGMRFHLPAFLIADLQGDYGFGMAFVLTHLTEYNIGRFALLSAPQRSAVRAFLMLIVDEPDYAFERPAIVRALAEFWTEDLGDFGR